VIKGDVTNQSPFHFSNKLHALFVSTLHPSLALIAADAGREKKAGY